MKLRIRLCQLADEQCLIMLSVLKRNAGSANNRTQRIICHMNGQFGTLRDTLIQTPQQGTSTGQGECLHVVYHWPVPAEWFPVLSEWLLLL